MGPFVKIKEFWSSERFQGLFRLQDFPEVNYNISPLEDRLEVRSLDKYLFHHAIVFKGIL